MFTLLYSLWNTLSAKALLGIKRIVSLLKILSWKPSFSKKSDQLTQVFTLLLSHNNSLLSSKFSSHWQCLPSLFALKYPKTLLGIKRIVSLLKILSWKPSFSKKSDQLTQVFTLLLSHNNSFTSSKFFSHWGCLPYFIRNPQKSPKTLLWSKRIVSC